MKRAFGLILSRTTIVVLALIISMAPAHDAESCIGSDGTIPDFGGSGPNGSMLAGIQSAWAGAAANGLQSPPTPPISGTHPTVIILIENSAAGAPFAYPTLSTWTTRLSDIASYYAEVSDGNLTISAATESHGTANDGVIGPLTVASLTSTSDIEGGNSSALAVEAIKAANPFINFAAFDTKTVNGDIEADELHILIYQAGDEKSYFGSSVPRAWAHLSWAEPRISGLTPATDSDSVDLMSYAYCGSELNGSQVATMGGMTHELGHDIGLPDLYDVDGTGSGGDWDGLGIFSLMAGGSWASNGGTAGSSPTHIDAVLKNVLGWNTVTPLTAPGDLAVELDAATEALKVSPASGDEYFVVEYRDGSGFDAGLPGSGAVVYHCDGGILTDNNIRVTNNINKNPSDFGIAVEEADGNSDLFTAGGNNGESADFFSSGDTFDASSTPNSNVKSGSASGVSLSDFSASGGTMSVDVGNPVVTPPTITSFVINNGDLKTGLPRVTLNSVVGNSPEEYMASEDSGFAGATWQTYDANASFTLSSGLGVKRVYFKAKNTGGGESSVVSDTIEVIEFKTVPSASPWTLALLGLALAVFGAFGLKMGLAVVRNR
ncbi:immune inhibitor A domain-containing protein [Candidatus Hydrogenedentota bacterium]